MVELIGAAGTVGCIVAGCGSLASRSGQVDVLSLGLVTGLMLVVLGGLARRFVRPGEATKTSTQPTKAASTFRALGGMLGNRQALLMLLVVLSTMVICLGDIHFKFQVARITKSLNQFSVSLHTAVLLIGAAVVVVRTLLTKGGVITAITVPVLLVIAR